MDREGALQFCRDYKVELEGLTERPVDPERVAEFRKYCGRRSSREEIAAYFILGGGGFLLAAAAITGFVTWIRWIIG